jgi:uncharacterized membrane protein
MISSKEETEIKKKEALRIEMFSDGVFAIAITLLALELIVMLHEKNQEGILKIILNHGQSFLAFFIGFCTILICWINHHHVFDYIHKSDTGLFWVNGFVLLSVTIVPFSTAALAEYMATEGKTAMAIFGFNFFIISVAAYTISAYPYKKHLINNNNREYVYCIQKMYAYSILYTFLALLVCFVSVMAAGILYFILFAVFAFPKEFASQLLKRTKAKKNKQKSGK